jgi:hypothetical protein
LQQPSLEPEATKLKVNNKLSPKKLEATQAFELVDGDHDCARHMEVLSIHEQGWVQSHGLLSPHSQGCG